MVLVSNEVSVIIVFCFSRSVVSVYLLAILVRVKPVVLTGEVQLQRAREDKTGSGNPSVEWHYQIIIGNMV